MHGTETESVPSSLTPLLLPSSLWGVSTATWLVSCGFPAAAPNYFLSHFITRLFLPLHLGGVQRIAGAPARPAWELSLAMASPAPTAAIKF